MPAPAHRPAYRKLLKLLVKARKDAGISQAVLAKRLGKTQSFISKVERGERRIDVIEFMDFTRAIGADYVKLLHRIGR